MREANSIIFPPFRLDILNEKLWRATEAISLRPKTFTILRYLAEHSGRLVSKAELLRAIWGETQVSEEGLRDYIREIRQALSDNAASPHFIETARGRGYRFVALPASTPLQVHSSECKVQSQDIGASSQYSVVSGKEKENQTMDMSEKRGQPTQTSPLLTIRGVYDGKTFRALPTESIPPVSREVSVAILFLEDVHMESESLADEILPNPLWQPQTVLNGILPFNGLKEEK